jgi:hypothetical protein
MESLSAAVGRNREMSRGHRRQARIDASFSEEEMEL